MIYTVPDLKINKLVYLSCQSGDNRIYASGVTPPPTVRRQLKYRRATVRIKEIKDGGMNEIIKTFMIILYLIFIIGSIRLL